MRRATAGISPEKFGRLGRKAYDFAVRHPSKDTRITVLEGAVRSGKTWALVPKMLQLCNYAVGGVGLIIGVSKGTVYTNVLNDLFDIIGPNAYRYNRQSGDLDLFGSWWRVMGANDEGSEKYIRGATVGKAIIDEATKVPESFWKMLMSRLSPPGARLYATTNPDSPHHYLKKDWIDNEELKQAGELSSIHFDLEDNPHLTPQYKAFLKRAYKGMFYLRYVKGLWVMAEGAIYRDCWSEGLLYDDESFPKIGGMRTARGCADRFVAMDYGTVHPHVYLDIIDDGRDIWVDREEVWDSGTAMRQKTDSQYVDDLERFNENNSLVIVPPECASFKAELIQRGIWHIDAENAVSDGIRHVSTLMSLKRLHVHRRCTWLLREIETYAWDTKKAERGLEEPIKKGDDAVDALRYGCFTKIAPWRLAA